MCRGDCCTLIEAIDLFAGAGGLTLGFKEAGIATIAAVEMNVNCVKTFEAHTPGADIWSTDIRQVDLTTYRGQVALIYGGPPCQPFSSGGLRAATGDDRDMIPAFVTAVRQVGPAAFFMENVPGLATGERARYLASVVDEFETMGYRVAAEVVYAPDFGVPQKRRRLFVVGMRGRVFGFPRPTHGPGRARPYTTVKDVLPPQQIGEPNPSKVFYARNPDLRPGPYDGHMFNGGGRAIDREQPCHTILASAGGNKTHFFDELGLVPAYHRHLMQGGAPYEGVLPGTRRLTVLESAILQTFPPDMVFSGPRSSQYLQVGNAVPPKLASALGRALVDQLLARDCPAESYEYPVQPRLLLA